MSFNSTFKLSLLAWFFLATASSTQLHMQASRCVYDEGQVASCKLSFSFSEIGASLMEADTVSLTGLPNNHADITFHRNLAGSESHWFAEQGYNTVNMLEHNGKFFGSLGVDDGWIYQIRPFGEGKTIKLYSIREATWKDEGEIDDEEVPASRNLRRINKNKSGATRALQSDDSPFVYENFQGLKSTDDGTVVDIMVPWTEKAECRASGLRSTCNCTNATWDNMVGMVKLAIAESNAAFEMSDVNMKLRLVYAYRTLAHHEPRTDGTKVMWAVYKELSGLWSRTDLNDEVEVLREAYGADIVQIVMGGDEFGCGVTRYKDSIGIHVDQAYTVTAYDCATGYFTFVHEIAHLTGANHDRGTENTCDDPKARNTAHGFRNSKENFRTIMGYSCTRNPNYGFCDLPLNATEGGQNGPCVRAQRFSNPGLEYNGAAVGRRGSNNAAWLNETAAALAGFKVSKCFAHVDCASETDICDSETKTCVACDQT